MGNRDADDMDELASLVNKSDESRRARDSNRPTRRRRNRSDVEATQSGRSGPESKPKDGRMWAVYGGRKYSACEQAVESLPPGQYTVDVSESVGIFFQKEDINLDELMVLPDSKSSEVIEEIRHFWTLEKKFREFGFLWKRGVILWGPPGSGKTSTLQIISKNIVDLGGISIYVNNPDLTARALKLLRPVEPQRQIVIMLEDIDAIVEEYGEAELLALMDGELQIDNVVFVATTNYPERLDRRFVNRPSRFDIIKKIGMPSAAAREVYLSTKNKRLANKSSAKQLELWVAETKGFSIAHLKELIISVEVFGQELGEAVERLRKMGQSLNSSKDTDAPFGFLDNGSGDVEV